jgi:hypothetical protein
MSLVNVTASGATLTKSGGCSGCPDGSAVSQQQISGSGTLQFATDETSSLRFVGLGSGGIGSAPGDINFAIRLQGGVAEVRESGAYRTEIGFGAGDTFSVIVRNGAVTYAKNGSVFHTSTGAATSAVRAVAVFFDPNGSIRNVTIGSGGAAATGEVPAAPSAESSTAAPTTAPTGTRYAVPRPAGSKPVRRR